MANGRERLAKAKRTKNDEFYTRMEDVSDELYHYRHHFKGKSVFLNCDDPEWSNFWKYFELNFEDLGLVRLVSTHYHATERTYKLVMERDEDGQITTTKTPLDGNGDFRSAECIALLDECDIVCTNPPFSLFREYVAQLIEHNKKFLIVGNKNAVTYKEIFPLIQSNKMWVGVRSMNRDFWLYVPDDQPYEKVDDNGRHMKHIMACWYTNLDIDKRHEAMTLWKDYDPSENPQYDNFDAIDVGKVDEIPCDYYGTMGVPITYMDKYCPEQFEIIGLGNGREFFTPTKDYINPKQVSRTGKQSSGGAINRVLCWKMDTPPEKGTYYLADNVDGFLFAPYARILIRRVDQPDTTE